MLEAGSQSEKRLCDYQNPDPKSVLRKVLGRSIAMKIGRVEWGNIGHFFDIFIDIFLFLTVLKLLMALAEQYTSLLHV